MNVYVDGERVLIAWDKRGPLTVVAEGQPLSEQYTEAGDLWYQSEGPTPYDEGYDAGYIDGEAQGVKDERAAARRRKTVPDWLKIVTAYLDEHELGDELLGRLAAHATSEKRAAS